jgi:hypothetical protein
MPFFIAFLSILLGKCTLRTIISAQRGKLKGKLQSAGQKKNVEQRKKVFQKNERKCLTKEGRGANIVSSTERETSPFKIQAKEDTPKYH